MDWFTSEPARNPGDILTCWVLAHEWGHSVQANWFDPGTHGSPEQRLAAFSTVGKPAIPTRAV